MEGQNSKRKPIWKGRHGRNKERKYERGSKKVMNVQEGAMPYSS